MTSKTDVESNRDIRTQGLFGIALLVVTVVLFVYRTGGADGIRYNTVVETTRAAVQTAQSDLQALFEEDGRERNVALLKKHVMFGWDFVPAWMFFIYFLQRAIFTVRRHAARYMWVALFTALLTLLANQWLNGYIATAERQTVTDAEWNRIVFFGQVKWGFLFLDGLIAALELFLTPLILRVGGIILAVSAVVGFTSMGVPSGLGVSYGVLGIFVAFFGICILLLFYPHLLYGAAADDGQAASDDTSA
jgi:hypothetical protein